MSAKISEKSGVKQVEIMTANKYQQSYVALYGNEEELLRAGWALDEIIAEFSMCNIFFTVSFFFFW